MFSMWLLKFRVHQLFSQVQYLYTITLNFLSGILLMSVLFSLFCDYVLFPHLGRIPLFPHFARFCVHFFVLDRSALSLALEVVALIRRGPDFLCSATPSLVTRTS